MQIIFLACGLVGSVLPAHTEWPMGVCVQSPFRVERGKRDNEGKEVESFIQQG